MSLSKLAMVIALAAPLTAPGHEQTIPLADWNPCGPSALYACARLTGMQVTRDRVIELCGVAPDGACSTADLVRAARALGFQHAVAVETTVGALSRFHLPAIVRDNQKSPPHFLAVIGQRRDEFLVFNPPQTCYLLQKSKAAQGWGGRAVLLSSDAIPGLGAASTFSLDRMTPLVVGLGIGIALGLAIFIFHRVLRRRTGNLGRSGTVTGTGSFS